MGIVSMKGTKILQRKFSSCNNWASLQRHFYLQLTPKPFINKYHLNLMDVQLVPKGNFNCTSFGCIFRKLGRFTKIKCLG